MEKNDTDPEGERVFDDVRDRTQPDPPRALPAAGEAAELLAKLSDFALPEDRVAETKGHFAAQFAAGPHAPPPRQPDAPSQPSVVVNVTAPLPAPVPIAPPDDRIAVVLPRGVDANTTVVGPHRKRGNARMIAAAAVFATTVILVAAVAARSPSRPSPTVEPSPSVTSITSTPATSIVTPTVTAEVASVAPPVAAPSATSLIAPQAATVSSSRSAAPVRSYGYGTSTSMSPTATPAPPSARASSPAPTASEDPDFGLFQRKRQ